MVTDRRREPVKVLFTAVSALGHIHPLIPLAQAFGDAGHDIRWATGADSCARLEAAGFRVEPAGMNQLERRAEYWRRYPDAAELKGEAVPAHMFQHLFGDVGTPPMLADLQEITASWRPDLVVHDVAEFAGTIAAALLGIPSVTHSYGTLLPLERITATAEMVAPIWRSVGLEPRPYGGSYEHLYLDIFPASLQPTDMAHVPHRQPLRPVAFDAVGEEVDIEFAHEDARPFVYLTLGTVFSSVDVLRTAIDAIAPLDVRLLVTVGPNGDPGLLGSPPPNVQVERYVPQTQVLGRSAVVVSHAGSGTFLAALTQGLPQLCLPQAADQFLNGRACVQAGAGLTLTPPEASVEAIATAVKRLLDDPTFGQGAAQVGGELVAMPSPADVVPILEALA
ncbi:MAG: glycosyltransferase [Acidimicrobiales bacterium]